MGFSNEGCCCCGVITGFLLAAAAGGVIWYFVFYCRENPEAPARDLKKVSWTWEKVKTGGDSLLEKARQETAEKTPVPQPVTQQQEFVPEIVTNGKE